MCLVVLRIKSNLLPKGLTHTNENSSENSLVSIPPDIRFMNVVVKKQQNINTTENHRIFDSL